MPDRLLTAPLWRPDDLGKPLPDSLHANSVCLPCWQDNVDYEEQVPRVLQKLQAGYPRFVFHPLTKRLFDACTARFAGPDEVCHAYPTRRAAERAAAFICKHAGVTCRVADWGRCGVYAVVLPARAAAAAKKFWQHTGDGVSSRRAEAALADADLPGLDPVAAAAKATIRERLAAITGARPEDVFLYPCGMSSIWHVSRALAVLRPGLRTVQYGFPYVDTLKIQQDLGVGAVFYPRGDGSELAELEELLASEAISGVFGEFPSNPLLITPDLQALGPLAASHGAALVIDDTLGTCVNVDVLSHVDVVTMSLTKYFSGSGDVMGGAAILNARSERAAAIRPILAAEHEDLLWGPDAVLLAVNSADFPARVRQINATTRQLVDYLAAQPLVAEVLYPSRVHTAAYDACRRPDGGYGGLFSLILQDEERRAPAFFDALAVCKGPNLGTRFTLSCPYTLLAHYGELDFARACGVSPHLVRVSVGLEPAAELIARFQRALDIAAQA